MSAVSIVHVCGHTQTYGAARAARDGEPLAALPCTPCRWAAEDAARIAANRAAPLPPGMPETTTIEFVCSHPRDGQPFRPLMDLTVDLRALSPEARRIAAACRTTDSRDDASDVFVRRIVPTGDPADDRRVVTWPRSLGGHETPEQHIEAFAAWIAAHGFRVVGGGLGGVVPAWLAEGAGLIPRPPGALAEPDRALTPRPAPEAEATEDGR